MKVGLLGLPLSGKTTVFNLLTGADAQTTSHAREGTVQPGVAAVPDPRVDALCEIYQPKKTTYAKINLLDIPGLRAGEATRFADALRDSDALVLVLRGFEDPKLGLIEPAQPLTDLQDLLTELIVCDLGIIERRLERLDKNRRSNNHVSQECEALLWAQQMLEDERLLYAAGVWLNNYGLYTGKPLLVLYNVAEDAIGKQNAPGQQELSAYAAANNIPLLTVSAPLEQEISHLPEVDRAAFLEDLGLAEPGVARLARAAYSYLDLISYFTVGPDEVRAWTINRGTTAKAAAGKIHSDIERGFIRAEVTSYEDLLRERTKARLREKGLMRLEGKEYPVADGDIISFRFNV